jgi:hypothetical protein
MAVWTPEGHVTLSATWTKLLDANPLRRFLKFAPSTSFYDAYWTTDASAAGTANVEGFPLTAGEDFGLQPGVCPTDAIYMRSPSGEVVTFREGF